MSDQQHKEVYNTSSFPTKLYTMLEDSKRIGFDDIVTWQSDEKSFKVLQAEPFAKEILSRYFNQTKYKSFQRQLNIYGFKRSHSGEFKGGYSHPLFSRSDPNLCSRMVRQNVNQKSGSKDKIPTAAKAPQNNGKPITKLDYPGLYNYFKSPENSIGNASSSVSDTSSGISNADVPARKETPLGTLLSVVSYHHQEQQTEEQEHSFPWKLHSLLADAEREKFQDVVSWVHDGSAFRVHDTTKFVSRIMPNYFDQTKYESFRRQLNLYGFSRVTRGSDKGVISHPHFVKGDRSLCRNITRKQGPSPCEAVT